MEKLKPNSVRLMDIDLSGLTHVSGPAGSGKTLFAVAFATYYARSSHVEWICADGKNSFISHLKRNVAAENSSNITIQSPSGYLQVQKAIMDLHKRIMENTSLIVIDPITRALDMSRENPIMWGQPYFEEILPTLAGLSLSQCVSILMISESRLNHEGHVESIFHDVVVKWLDQDFVLKRDILGKTSDIYSREKDQPFAKLSLNEHGVICITGTNTKKEAISKCSENYPVCLDT